MTQSLPRVNNTEVNYFSPRYRQLISFASRIYCHDVDCVTHRHVPASATAAAGYTCYHHPCCYQYSSHYNKNIANKLALLWGEAQKKIAYSYLKVT